MAVAMDVALIVDVDGTLVDSAYEHVLAWARAFRAHDVVVPSWRIHRAVGMGGDQLITEVAGSDVEERLGDRIREVEREAYAEYLPHITAFPGAKGFLERCGALGTQVVLASSSATWTSSTPSGSVSGGRTPRMCRTRSRRRT